MLLRLRVLQQVLRNRRLRRVQLAFLGFGCAEYGVWVAILVYAYQHGGTVMAAALAAGQLIPAAIVAPLGSRLSDRHGPAFTLRTSYLLQGAALLFTGGIFLSGLPPGVGYVGAVAAASAVTLTRPAQGALLPSLVQTPRELTAANAVSGWVESVSMLVGPLVAGALIAADGAGLALLAFGVVLVIGWVSLAGLEPHRSAGDVQIAAESDVQQDGDSGSLTPNRSLIATFALFLIQFIAVGAIDVLVVVLAVKVLGIGGSGAGYLQGAFGAGAVLGGIVAILLVGRRSVIAPLLGASATWGGAFILLAWWHTPFLAFALLGLTGASRTVFDVSGRTLLHRSVPPDAHSRAFGVLEGLAMLGLASGSLAVPLLIGLGGITTALLVIGGLLLVTSIGLVSVLHGLDALPPAPADGLELLRKSPIFSMLAGPVIEDLARALIAQSANPGEEVIRQGDTGEQFFLVNDGELDVFVDDVWIRTLQRGEGFGEIALLRDCRRTATVISRTPADLRTLTRPWFLEAVTGSRQAQRAADDLISARLEPDTVRVGSVK